MSPATGKMIYRRLRLIFVGDVRRKRWSDASFGRLEQGIILGFYGVRKLRDSRKIADRLRYWSVPLDEFAPTGESVSVRNRTELDEIYKMDSRPRTVKKPLEFLCNQIIHSYIFTPGFNEEGFLEDLFFASDQQKDFGMFCTKIEEIVSLFEEVDNNNPSYMYIPCGRSGRREIFKVGDEREVLSVSLALCETLILNRTHLNHASSSYGC